MTEKESGIYLQIPFITYNIFNDINDIKEVRNNFP